MPGSYVIGVDCSTTAAKAVVWDATGRAVAEGRSAFSVSHPQPGWGEQRPEDWWVATAAAIAQAVRLVDARLIRGLCITHQRETFACLDERGHALRPALLWMDMRAAEQVETHGTPDVHRVTGKPPNPTPAWYKLLWLAEHEPETLRRTARVVDVQGYLVQRITGSWRTGWPSADPLGLVDLSSFDYDDGLLAKAGLSRDQLCELYPPGSVLGEVSGEVADELGLPAGLPVVAGAGDGQSAGLGCNVTAPGSAYVNLGTGVVSGVHSDEYRHDLAYRTMASALPGSYVLETFIGGGTHNVSWFVDKLGGVDASALGLGLSAEQILETAAAQLPAGAEGLICLPYWTGALTPYWESRARGALVGLSGIHGKGHIYRAILESIAFEQRLLTDGAQESLGQPIERMVVTGGGSRSELWCRILADVLQRPVLVVREQESTALGAGMLAAAATGLADGIEQAAAAMSGVARCFEPDEAGVRAYEELYGVYRQLYPSLRDVFPRLLEASAP
jgi:xylulokinase